MTFSSQANSAREACDAAAYNYYLELWGHGEGKFGEEEKGNGIVIFCWGSEGEMCGRGEEDEVRAREMEIHMFCTYRAGGYLRGCFVKERRSAVPRHELVFLSFAVLRKNLERLEKMNFARLLCLCI